MGSEEKNMAKLSWLEKSKLALDRYIVLSQLLLESKTYCEETERKRLAAFHNFNCYSFKAQQVEGSLEKDNEYLEKVRFASEMNSKILDLWKHCVESYKAESIHQNRSLHLVQRYQLRKPLLQRFSRKY